MKRILFPAGLLAGIFAVAIAGVGSNCRAADDPPDPHAAREQLRNALCKLVPGSYRHESNGGSCAVLPGKDRYSFILRNENLGKIYVTVSAEDPYELIVTSNGDWETGIRPLIYLDNSGIRIEYLHASGHRDAWISSRAR